VGRPPDIQYAVQIDAHLNIVPSLAKSWDISEDKKTYRFHLRRDVFFHDDDVFPAGRAEDWLLRISYMLVPLAGQKNGQQRSVVFNEKVDGPASFTAPDDSTFELRLLTPFHPMLGLLSMQYVPYYPVK